MRWEMEVVTKSGRLRKRTGPSTSYRIVEHLNPGYKGIVVESKTVGGATWYRWENTQHWSCGKTAKGVDYLKKIKDLEPPVEPTPPNPEPEPEPEPTITIDSGGNYSGTNYTGTSNLSGDQLNREWYISPAFNYETYAKNNINYGSLINVDESVIMKRIWQIKYNMDISYSNIEDTLYTPASTGYYTDLQAKLYNSFNRNKTAYPDKELNKTFAYVFFTRPDLNILDTSTNGTIAMNDQSQYDPKYKFLYKNNPWCLKSLVLNGNPHHKFLILLSNEAKSFEINDTMIKTVEHGETYTGHKVVYGQSDIESNAAGEMSIRYVDTVNLDIFKLHVVWTDYINKVSRGVFEPKREYKIDRILDYASSCYYFLCGADGSTILYWQKLTGVFPVNTGENAFSWDSGTLLAKPEINIKYMYSMRNTMDPYILHEFNSLTKYTENGRFKSTYSDKNCQSGSTLTHSPYIWETEINGKKVYRLMWFDIV